MVTREASFVVESSINKTRGVIATVTLVLTPNCDALVTLVVGFAQLTVCVITSFTQMLTLHCFFWHHINTVGAPAIKMLTKGPTWESYFPRHHNFICFLYLHHQLIILVLCNTMPMKTTQHSTLFKHQYKCHSCVKFTINNYATKLINDTIFILVIKKLQL